jgi:hypothetical protein
MVEASHWVGRDAKDFDPHRPFVFRFCLCSVFTFACWSLLISVLAACHRLVIGLISLLKLIFAISRPFHSISSVSSAFAGLSGTENCLLLTLQVSWGLNLGFRLLF